MMFCTWLAFIFWFCVSLHAGFTEKCKIEFHSKLKARSECFINYADCGFENLQARFPKLYNKTEWKRDPPSNVKPYSFCEPDTSGVNQSGLNVQWNLPESQSAAGIAGYELRIEGDPPNFRCLVVILEEKPKPENIRFILNSTMKPVKRRHNYMIVLHSLPRANNSETKAKLVMSMNCKRGLASMDWSPAGHNYSYKWEDKKLTVWFPPPPLELKITKFKLDLFGEDRRHIALISNKTKVIFTGMKPGEYTLYMKPHGDDLSCVCKDDEGTCAACKLSKWQIVIKIPKNLSVPVTESHLQDILVGVGIFVVITIAVLLLYKFLAKRFGIECILGDEKISKTDMVHVLCVDWGSTKENASKLKVILENDLKHRVKFIRINALSEADISLKMASVWKKLKIPKITEKEHVVCSEKADCDENIADDKFKILICLLISRCSNENVSDYLSEIQANIPRARKLQVQMCAVTFADNQIPPQCNTALKCYFLEKDKQTLVAELKKAFPNIGKDQPTSVVYTSNKTNSDPVAKNGFKVHENSANYVDSKQSTNCNGHYCKTVTDMGRVGICEPEVKYLGVSEPRRERYVSNDSGRGISELSYKQDDRDGLLEGMNSLPVSKLSHPFPSTNQNGLSISKYHVTGTDCPSCDISFFPPDPSIISENDFDPSTIDFDDYAMKEVPQQKCLHCNHGIAKQSANSLDSLMDKMAEINERSAMIMQENSSPGEVHSVWEGHV